MVEFNKQFPPVTRQNIDNTRFANWFEKYRLKSIESTVIPLPVEFIEYLCSDNVFAPSGLPKSSGEYDALSDDTSSSVSDDSEAGNALADFPELETLVNSAIKRLGGQVFPKLSWSCPRDAAWIKYDNSLSCTDFGEIALLLKSSDIISHVINHAYDICIDADGQKPADLNLVLRRWYDMHPASQFRCFIRNHTIIGACQRDQTNFYPFLLNTHAKIKKSIESFIADLNAFTNPDYVLDLHMNMSSNDLFIIDFNPFATITDSLLFDWPELLSTINNEMFELRLISGTEDNRLETRVANSENRVPLEMIEFSQTEKGMSDFIKLVKDEYLDQKKSIDS